MSAEMKDQGERTAQLTENEMVVECRSKLVAIEHLTRRDQSHVGRRRRRSEGRRVSSGSLQTTFLQSSPALFDPSALGDSAPFVTCEMRNKGQSSSVQLTLF